jgi:hypothetical protein
LQEFRHLHQRALEVEAQRELQIPLAAADATSLGQYLPEGVEVGWVESDIGGPAAPAAAAPIRMVNKVEGLGAELKSSLLVNSEVLEKSEIPVLISRLVDEVANTLSVERTRSRFGKDR